MVKERGERERVCERGVGGVERGSSAVGGGVCEGSYTSDLGVIEGCVCGGGGGIGGGKDHNITSQYNIIS